MDIWKNKDAGIHAAMILKMRQYLITLLAVLYVSAANGQANIYPDTFPNSAGYRSVTVKMDYTCTAPVRKNETIAKYLFDNAGKTTEFLSINENKPYGRQLYSYYNNRLVAHKNFSSFLPDKRDPSNYAWDSTMLSSDISFEYDGDKLSTCRVNYPQMKGMSYETNYGYNSAGQLVFEGLKTFYDSVTAKLEVVQLVKTCRKEYTYSDTVTMIKCYNGHTLTATEEIITLKNGKVLKQTLKAVDGKILRKKSYKYNDRMQVVEINDFETGIDEYGNAGDFAIGIAKAILKYDNEGKLVSREYYDKGKTCYSVRYVYTK